VIWFVLCGTDPGGLCGTDGGNGLEGIVLAKDISVRRTSLVL
jgi:hypothetical protein